MEVLSKELAAAEVSKWLDFMQISATKRAQLAISVSRLTEAVEEGVVVINDDLTLTQTLKFPFGKETKVTGLKFKTEVTVGQVQQNMIGAADNDQYASSIAHISAATGELKEVIQQMNTKDYKISDAIAVFFML